MKYSLIYKKSKSLIHYRNEYYEENSLQNQPGNSPDSFMLLFWLFRKKHPQNDWSYRRCIMLNLDEIWDFAYCQNLEETPEYSSVASVPGCFDAMGLRFNQRGFAYYRRKVKVQQGRQRLRIGSFGLRAAVFWDGDLIAESALAWSPLTAEFSASAGEHELVIRTDNLLEGHPLFREYYDFYGFGGIYDQVTLEPVEPVEIRYLAVIPLNHETGEVEIRVETDAPVLTIRFDEQPEIQMKTAPKIRLRVPDFRLWSPETPFLHKLTVNGKETEFGIRTIDWHGDHLKLNGKKLQLRGVNRHESHPEFGPATPESLIASDLLQIKRAGFNFVRGSHYPQREFFFRMCDRLGILVWEEPLSWGNPVQDLSDSRFMDTLAEQLELTIRTSINHPSLLIHGFLNECASNTEPGVEAVRRLMNICHEIDPSRPATFASNRPHTDRCLDLTDIIALNVYPAWYGEEKIAEIPAFLDSLAAKFQGKPRIISEIGAAAICGDHSGAPWSEEYQTEYIHTVMDSIEKNPAWSGVILWLFCNANTYTGTTGKVMRPRGFNNKGLLDEYRRPKQSWLLFDRKN